ncbi:(2Fe-2S)-binding protein [Marinisporobacter balticus]|nr:(2Fe-2S)-binding protein [Marinisporobacter balticus]
MSDEIICRCEEITESEIVEAIRNGATTVNEIKKWTRAGMGLCQGRTCRRMIERILARETGIELKDIKPSTYRQPVRPIKMGALGE